MWPLLLSALLCLPALAVLFLGLSDNLPQKQRDLAPIPAMTMSSAAEPPPSLELSLPPVRFSIEPATTDPEALGVPALALAGLQDGAISPAEAPPPVRSDSPGKRTGLAMRHPVRKVPARHVPDDRQPYQPDPDISGQSPVMAFIQRHLTRYSFAPPNQNSGG